MIEIVYTWPDGREEVRYRRGSGSPEAISMKREVDYLKYLHGDACPYSYRAAVQANEDLA